MNETVTISKEAAEIIDRWFLPANPNKLRRGPSADLRQEARDAINELRIAIRSPSRKEGWAMVNALVHPTRVSDWRAVEDTEQLIEAVKWFGDDLPLDRTMVVETLVETLSDGSEVATLRIRPAEPV